MKPATLLISVLVLTALTGCGVLPSTSPKGLSRREARGWEIYARRCISCHAINGQGGTRAGDLTYIAKDRDEQWLRKLIKDPKSISPWAKMPQSNLSRSRIDDLVQYLLTLK